MKHFPEQTNMKATGNQSDANKGRKLIDCSLKVTNGVLTQFFAWAIILAQYVINIYEMSVNLL